MSGFRFMRGRHAGRCGHRLLFLAVLLLAGCGDPDGNSAEPSPEPPEPDKVEILLEPEVGGSLAWELPEQELLADPGLPERLMSAEYEAFTGMLELRFPTDARVPVRVRTRYRDGTDIGPLQYLAGDILLRDHVTDGTVGVERLWWGPERPRSVVELRQQSLHGDWQAYYATGSPGFRIGWREGRPHGDAEGWNPDGELVFRGRYELGEPVAGVLPETLDALINRVLLSPRWFEENGPKPTLALVDTDTGERHELELAISERERCAWEQLRRDTDLDADVLERAMRGSMTELAREEGG